MGMVVRTNMAGLNANNALNAASKTQQNAMQKLASGFRINKAADDASGLAISEKMKNQIKALDTAADNCEDGANMIQTAEGYMAETHDILNRMTELAEKAANGVLDDKDRDALQDEMNELCGEIDRMATTANFNGHKLMDGSLGSTDSLTLSASSDTKKITYTAPDSQKMNLDDKFSFDLSDTKFSTLKPGSYKFSSDGKNIINADTEVKMTDAAGNAIEVAEADYGFRIGDTIKFNDTGKTGTSTTNGVTITEIDNADLAGATFTYDGTEWVSNDTGSKQTITPTLNKDLATDLGSKTFTVTGGINLQIGDSSTTSDRLEVKINSFHTDTLFGGLDGFVNSTNDKTDNVASAAVKIIKPDVTAGSDANSASTYKNGVTIDISDKDAASAAADAIRQVSDYVSDERGKLGAQQNRLEHTVNNLTTTSENMTAANSRIRDTNMAEEMMNYTSKNVIAQAAQAMLAQANSQPQNVLSLLQ